MKTETQTASLADMRAFCEVVDFGTITAAARRLGESKGAISRRITRLEARLGVRLLARTSRAVTATEAGLAFHSKAQAGLALLDEAADSARGEREIPRGNLRITSSVDISVELLPRIIVAFRARYPQILVEIIATDTPIDLAAHRIDLALRIRFGDLPDQAYRGTELMSGTIGAYAAPSWIAAHGMPLSFAELTERELVVSEKERPGQIFRFSNSEGQIAELRGRPAIRVSDLASALRLAEEGAGVALLPDLITRRAMEQGHIVRVLKDWRIDGLKLYALTLAGRDVPARVRLFRDFMKLQCAALQGADA